MRLRGLLFGTANGIPLGRLGFGSSTGDSSSPHTAAGIAPLPRDRGCGADPGPAVPISSTCRRLCGRPGWIHVWPATPLSVPCRAAQVGNRTAPHHGGGRAGADCGHRVVYCRLTQWSRAATSASPLAELICPLSPLPPVSYGAPRHSPTLPRKRVRRDRGGRRRPDALV